MRFSTKLREIRYFVGSFATMEAKERYVLGDLLNQYIKIEDADFGNIQVFDPENKNLNVVAQHGFDESFLNYFASVKAFDPSCCGRAFGLGITVRINDVEEDVAFAGHRAAARDAGFRSVKSAPIFGKDMTCIGIISTHFIQPKTNWQIHPVQDVVNQIALILET